MKKLTITSFVLFFIIFAIPPLLPSSVGHALLEKGTLLEAQILGLDEYHIDMDNMTVSYYSNQLSDQGANQENRPTLLLLHGYSADKTVWPRFSKHFHDQYRVLVPDMAGHGKTGFNEEWDYSTPAQAKRMAHFLDKLNIEQVHVVGNSMGGNIAAQFALLYPHRTLSATLIDPSGVKSPEPSLMDTMLDNGRNPFEVDNHNQFSQFFAMTMASPPYFPDILIEAASEKYQQRKLELRRIFKDLHQKDMLDDSLSEIQVPVLLLWGAKDQIIHVSSAKVWQAGVPNIEVKIWEDIGHMPMLEIPSESAQVVADFIIKHQGAL